MTAPTPDYASVLVRLGRVADAWGDGTPTLARLSSDAITTLIAERDQARQMLADAEKKIASMELDESLREEDERFADPL